MKQISNKQNVLNSNSKMQFKKINKSHTHKSAKFKNKKNIKDRGEGGKVK